MNPPARFVLDTSTTMAWCFEDEGDAYADGVLDALKYHGAIVPALWILEVSNVLLVAERRGRIDSKQAEDFVMLLAELPIYVRDTSDIHHTMRLIRLGREQQLGAYDAAFLMLAKQTALPLATRDNKLAQAARRVDVQIYDPHGS